MRLSLDKLIRFWCKKNPLKTAISLPSKPVSYSTLSSMAEAVSCELLAPNYKHGLIIHDSIQYVAVILAMMRDRRVFVNIGCLITKELLPGYMQKNGISDVVTDDTDIINSAQIASIDIKTLIKQKDQVDTFSVEQQLNDEVGGFLTSGTTGMPKVYYRNQYSLISEALLWIMELGLTKDTSFYVSKPFSYMGSFVLMYSVLYAGGTLFIPNQFHDISLPNNILDYVFLTPAEIRHYLHTTSLMNCKNVITMGAPITAQEKIMFADKYNCNVYEMWGNSEGLATITNLKEDPQCQSLGRATFTDEIFTVDSNGYRLPCNRIGFIAGITDNGIVSDAGHQEIISEDIGYIDNDGKLHLIDRIGNILMFPDGNYFCASTFEGEIRQQVCADDVAVVLSDEKVTVFVQATRSPKVYSKISQMFLSRYKQYVGCISLASIRFIPSMPYTENGKIDYKILKAIVSDMSGQEYNEETGQEFLEGEC